MDILNPTAPAIPHHESSSGQAALDQAEKALSEFKALSKEATVEATNLIKAAKDLVREVAYNCEEGSKKVLANEWTEAQLEQSKANLIKKQEKPWQVMQEKADAIHKRVEGHYKVLMASKENVVRARGDAVTGALFGALTDDQKKVRKVYDNKMKIKIDEAAVAYDNLAGFPDGLLTKIGPLRKKAMDALGGDHDASEHAEKAQNLFLAAQEKPQETAPSK